MEPRTIQATQEVLESFPLEGNIDAIELTDEDLEKATGTWGHFGVIGGLGFHSFPFHRPPFFGFNNAIAINNVAIAIA